MADLYVNLDKRGYKALEAAMRAFEETVHTSVEGFYHKSIRIPVDGIEWEFHGPAVKTATREFVLPPPFDDEIPF